MQPPEKSVLLAEAQQSRRLALRTIAAATGSALFFGAAHTGLLPTASTLAMNDDNNSGHGSNGSGSGHGGDGEEDGAVAPQAQIPLGSTEIHIVSDDADGFSPNKLTVDLGQSVTFVNTHHDEHTATGSGFDTGIIPAGGIATVLMNEPGIFLYACQIHPVMTGRIAVRDENGVVPEPQTVSASLTADATQVQIANLAFNPATMAVSTGNTVTWSNDDTIPHTVTALDGLFDSGILDPGGAFSWTFTDPGSIDYHCQLHPNMQGTVTVEGAAVAGGATTAEAATPAAGASAASVSAEASIWIADFAPDDATVLAPQRALLSFHADGLVNADFAAAGAAAADQRLTAAHGRWQLNVQRLDLALVAFVVDAVGQFRGTLAMQAEGNGSVDSGSLNGTWTFSLADAGGAVVGDGGGFWQGSPAPLDLETATG